MKGDLKTGFWIGLGVALAFAVWAFIQTLAVRAVGKVAEG
jgi:hypothetical protein